MSFQTGQTGFCVKCNERSKVKSDRKGLFFKDKNSVTCVLSCCFSCTFCRRVAAKERRNSRTSKINKICERCFLCKSLEFCTKCHKCPTCCTKSSCRVKIAQVLGKMGSPRRQPQSGFSPQRGLRPTLPVQTLSDKKIDNNKLLCRSSQELPESKLHINYLELKAVLLALKEFQALCTNKVVLIATDNTTVVAYINKEGGMKSGPLCALLWRILTWYARNQVILKARHIPSRLNVIADKLSRLGQTIHTEWSLNPEIFKAICDRWHRPQVDLFATRFNNKLPHFVSPVPDPQAWAVDALSLSWEELDPYAFPPAAILGKVVEKLQDYPYNRIILIAPGWPNMPWFWDLVAMSSQIPLCLPSIPNLGSQPFNQVLHRNLSNLNLHAWLLEPQQSRNRASLRQWQHELRLLKEDQPDLSMRQSGPFLQSGASVIRWTSEHHL